MRNWVLILGILFSGCFMYEPIGRELAEKEQVYLDRAVRLYPHWADTLKSVRVLPSEMATQCQPNAASCALVTAGVIVYDGEDSWAFVHELVHLLIWLEHRDADYGHDLPGYWDENDGLNSVQSKIYSRSYHKVIVSRMDVRK